MCPESMAKHARAHETSDRMATLYSLPHDTLGKVIRALSFQDKCSLELVSKEFHGLLGSPSPTARLWGTCDLMADLKVEQNLDSTGDIMRWLTRRLSGFTHLVCNAACAHQDDEAYSSLICDTRSAATWLVAHLPKLCSASTSTFKLHLTLDSVLAAKLLWLSLEHQRIQDEFWPALSERLTELSLDIPDADNAVRMDVLNHLTSLTGLKIRMNDGATRDTGVKVAESYTMNLPRLTILHLSSITVEDLILLCPRLRSLTLDYPSVRGCLSLPASLEELSIRGFTAVPMHEASMSGLRGLTSLLCNVPGGMQQDFLFGILPSMSALRSLDLALCDGQLPPRLPRSLRAIRYYLVDAIFPTFARAVPLSPRELQHFLGACRLPELQSLSLYDRNKWSPGVLQALERIQAKSSVPFFVVDNWEDNIRRTYPEQFFFLNN